MPPKTKISYPSGGEVTRSEAFTIATSKGNSAAAFAGSDGKLVLPAGVSQAVRGSSWGTFTIACTIPIALFVGWYMSKFRPGKVVEASVIGAAAVLAALYCGWILYGIERRPLLAGIGFGLAGVPVYLWSLRRANRAAAALGTL